MAVNLPFWQCDTNVLIWRTSFTENAEEGNVHRFSESSAELYDIQIFTETKQQTKWRNQVPGSGLCQAQLAWMNSKHEKVFRSAETFELSSSFQEYANYNIVPCVMGLLTFVVDTTALCKTEYGF